MLLCRHKRKFKSLREAELEAEYQESIHNYYIRAYYCDFCDSYHLTSQTYETRAKVRKHKRKGSIPYSQVKYKEIDKLGNRIRITKKDE